MRHFRVGGYAWGDMSNVAKDVPESIRKYYNREWHSHALVQTPALLLHMH